MTTPSRHPWFRSVLSLALAFSVTACATKPPRDRVELAYPLSSAEGSVRSPDLSARQIELEQTDYWGQNKDAWAPAVIIAGVLVVATVVVKVITVGTRASLYPPPAKPEPAPQETAEPAGTPPAVQPDVKPPLQTGPVSNAPVTPAAPATGETELNLPVIQLSMADITPAELPVERRSESGSRLVVQVPGLAKPLIDLGAKERTVTMPAFRIDRTEVTVEQYELCVKAGRCNLPDRGEGCNYGNPERRNDPVNCVALYQAEDFCKWTGRRLPTETEWERAARGSNSRAYPWGSDEPTCERAVTQTGGRDCGMKSTWPVCSKTSGNTPDGLCDMAGNVREWTSSIFGGQSKDSGDPVFRGGSWKSEAVTSLRTDGREHGDSTFRGDETVGFRCAQ